MDIMKKIPENTRILLVEDEKNLVRIILDTLVQEGFEKDYSNSMKYDPISL